MNGPHLTVRATRFFSSATLSEVEDADDDESNTEGLDDGGGMEEEIADEPDDEDKGEDSPAGDE